VCCCRIAAEELNKNVKYLHHYSWSLDRSLIQGNARDVNMMTLVIIMVIMRQVDCYLMKVKIYLEEYCIINSRLLLCRSLFDAHLIAKLINNIISSSTIKKFETAANALDGYAVEERYINRTLKRIQYSEI
jgi:hypothetical protein